MAGFYFHLSFDNLSSLDMIENATLRELLRKSLLSIEQNNLEKSLILSKVAFEWAVSALLKFLPEQQISEPFFQAVRLHQSGSPKEIFEELLNISKRPFVLEYCGIFRLAGRIYAGRKGKT